MKTDEVMASLRVRLGSVSESDVPEEQLAEAIAGALRRYSWYRGPTRIAQVNAAKDQAEIDLPAEVVRVHEVAWNLDTQVEPDPFDLETMLYQTNIDPAPDISLFDNPSLLHIWYSKFSSFKQRFRGEWEETIGPTGGQLRVRIMPPAAADSTKVYLYCRLKIDDVNKIPEGELETFFDAALWQVYETRVTSAAGLQSISFPGGGGSMTFSTEDFKKMAESFEKRFKMRAGAAAGPVH